MNGKKVLGMVFANIHEETLDSLTAMRTMGSVPFCSRYRLIDFPLSNMVESGVTKIGVITNANFQSLMDHVGNGKPWDLSRKNDGLFILPPFNVGSATMWGNRIDAIYGNKGFLEQSNQTYVVMSDCNNVLSLDYEALLMHTKLPEQISQSLVLKHLCRIKSALFFALTRLMRMEESPK